MAHFALKTSAGRVSFLIPVESGFHKNIYKTFRFSLFNFLQSLYTRSGYQHFFKNDTRRIRFSQKNLQNVSILTF